MAGNKAPEINLPDSSGKEISLIETAKKNPYTLLFIWDPDCSHCMESLHLIKEIYNKYHPKGLEIFGVSLNESKEEWLKGIRKNQCNWINVMINERNRQQPEEYFITYTPTLVLINREGVIVRRQITEENIEAILLQLFEN